MQEAWNASDSTRIYGASTGGSIFILSIAAVLAGIGGVLGVKLAAIDDPWIRVIGAFCILFGIALCAAMVHLCRSKVVLNAGTIEVHSLTGKTVVQREEIVGRNDRDGVIVLQLRGGHSPISLPSIINADDEFNAWMKSVPNLDPPEIEVEEKVRVNPSLGRRRPIERSLHLVTLIVIFWTFFYPYPNGLVMTLLIAWPFLIVMVGRVLGTPIRFSAVEKIDLPDGMTVLLAPAIILTLHAMTPNFYYWPDAVTLTLGAGVITGSLLVAADRQLLFRLADISILLVFLLPLYGYGAGVQINRLLDSSPPTIFEVHVAGKANSGRSLPGQLELSPWGPSRISTVAWVSRAVYESVKPGDTVCVHLHTGGLRVRRYVVRACPSRSVGEP